jgi:hypothetical protein
MYIMQMFDSLFSLQIKKKWLNHISCIYSWSWRGHEQAGPRFLREGIDTRQEVEMTGAKGSSTDFKQ